MQFKRVLTFNPREAKVRLFRVMWQRGVMMKGGYSAKLSVSLVPRLFQCGEQLDTSFRLTILGLSFHYARSYGGRFV